MLIFFSTQIQLQVDELYINILLYIISYWKFPTDITDQARTQFKS